MTERTLERAAWSCLGAGIVGSFVHVLGGATNIGSVVYGLALLAIVVSTVISATRHQLDRRILSGFFVIIAAIIIGFFSQSIYALSLSIPKSIVDNAISKKFPKEKLSISLDKPTVRRQRV